MIAGAPPHDGPVTVRGGQDDLLGAGEAKLWRQDRINVADLPAQTSRPLTLRVSEAQILS